MPGNVLLNLLRYVVWSMVTGNEPESIVMFKLPLLTGLN